MAVVLYKPGASTTVRGIPCDLRVCDEHSFEHLLDDGWFLSPEACYEKSEEAITEEIETPTEEEVSEEVGAETENSEEELEFIEDKDIRVAAKKAGIGNYWNKTIPNLKEELKNVRDEG